MRRSELQGMAGDAEVFRTFYLEHVEAVQRFISRRAVADSSVDRLPDTPANGSLLQISAHAGATPVQETCAQYRAAQGWAPLAADAAKGARSR